MTPNPKNIRRPLAGDQPLADVLDAMVHEGELYESLPDNKVRCYACAHECKISPGGRGICQVRYNADGKLFVPWGYVSGLQCDPVEKKPFFHVHPGTDALTFGMLGCDMHCSYCQNWLSSQTLRDAAAGHDPVELTPQIMINTAKRLGACSVASSYNEPLITSEWAVEIFKEARQEDLTCLYISNGNATREVLEYIRPYVDGYKIDLKSMRDKPYRQLGAVRDDILAGIRMVHEMGFWLEIVTLVVPGFNDSAEELRDIAQFLVSLSPDIPWHVTAFHPDYKMQDMPYTSVQNLLRAVEIGEAAGLNYVYAGNLPGRVGKYENTRCPHCQTTLIERYGYIIRSNIVTADGTCPECATIIPGLW